MDIQEIDVSKIDLLSENTCRICFVFDKNLKSIFDVYEEDSGIAKNSQEEPLNYIELYQFCTGLQIEKDVSEEINITTKICNSCTDSLVYLSNFKKKCQYAEDVIRNFINDSKQIKYENFKSEGVENEKNFSNLLGSNSSNNSNSWNKVEKLEDEDDFIVMEDHLNTNTENLSNSLIEHLIESNIESDDDLEEFESQKTADEGDEESEETYKCEICQKSYKKKCYLAAHMRKQHAILETSNSDQFADEYPEDEVNRADLIREKKREFNRKRYLCPICGKLALISHIKAHTSENVEGQIVEDKPFTCEICGLKYKTSNSLTKHKRKHSDDKRYKCEYCDEKFLHWASRRNHVYLKHTGERRYECHFCEEKFYQKGKFNIHIRRHTGELPFACDVCGKKFITNVALKYHSICHSNQKDHICKICGKAFGRKKSLTTHLKIHTGEKNYVCPVCNKAFIQNHVLRTHMKSHPGIELPRPGTVVSQKVLKNQEKFQYPDNMYFAHYNN